MSEDTSRSRQSGARTGFLAVLAVVLLGTGLWGYLEWSGTNSERQRAETALSLQVLASRLGAVALLAQYEDYEEARSVAAGVFDGIRNFGIQQGALPENYVTVLEARDSVMRDLDREDPAVKGRLVDLFFLLQLPVDTELDPGSIIPATDSGSGITPPQRDTPTTDTLPFAPGEGVLPTAPDTTARTSPPDTIPPDTIPPDTSVTPGVSHEPAGGAGG